MERLSYQLYSSRGFPPLEKTLAMLAKEGYKEVEGFGGVYQDPGATSASLEAAGLEMPSGHFDIDVLEQDLEACLGVARTLGVKTIYSPWLKPEDRPTDATGWRDLGERLAKIQEPVNGAGTGLRLAQPRLRVRQTRGWQPPHGYLARCGPRPPVGG